MRRPRIIALCCLTIALLTAGRADDSPPAEAETPSPARANALSPDLAAALTASLPRFTPPPMREGDGSGAEAEANDDDLFADLPKPKNGIVRLPRVVVEGSRPPVFSEKEIHTAKGLADIAVKRYFDSQFALALNRYTLPLVGMGKEAYALMLYEQDERLRLLREYGEEADLLEAGGDDQRAAELRDLLHDTLSHEPLFLSPAHAPYRDARGQ